MNSTTQSVFRVGVLAIGSLLGIEASRAQAQAPAYSVPAPRYDYPAAMYSYPAPRYVSPTPMYSSPAPVRFYPARVSTPWSQHPAYLLPAWAYSPPFGDNYAHDQSEPTDWAGGATPY
ncbi:MAG: hypothetical protein JO284_19100 [Planctomycetaceae bacterium]|nr:hypothetical protein [Planctomycetaceae bacterium]MBV8609976.1 hypothetical protein [Singulisphaera sp.]MBV8229360.1 hypothetical protein [Planctomycetaceae bacterium]MBV8315646.1 hypothetical protein [Planctomycetaceae bacterium]MBV8383609.1 hypothetical protein [Planctomycetaceae bacterium]